MTIQINIDSLGSILGAIVSLTYALYFLIHYRVVERNRVKLLLALFLFSMFIFFMGYSLYSSATKVRNVLLWTRVCYAGGALVAYYSYHLSSRLIERESHVLHMVFLIYVSAAIVLIFFPGGHLFTETLNPEKYHSSLIKGPIFPGFLLSILIMDSILLVRFIRGLRGNRNIHLISPLIFGFAFWLAEAIFNGILGAILSLIEVQLIVGPIVMMICLALYSARYTAMKNKELASTKDENRQIVQQLIYDQLSGLYSRQYFLEFMEQRLSHHKRNPVWDCLIFLDMDNFKSVNDELGHQKGDELIALMGDILNEHSRASDICARYGGDEFLLLLENCGIEDAKSFVVKIQKDFEKKICPLMEDWGGCVELSLSIGIIDSSRWTDRVRDTIERADLAMYSSKKTGKNRVTVYTEDFESPLK